MIEIWIAYYGIGEGRFRTAHPTKEAAERWLTTRDMDPEKEAVYPVTYVEPKAPGVPLVAFSDPSASPKP